MGRNGVRAGELVAAPTHMLHAGSWPLARPAGVNGAFGRVAQRRVCGVQKLASARGYAGAEDQAAAIPRFSIVSSHFSRISPSPSTPPISVCSTGLIPASFKMLRSKLFTLWPPK